MNHFKNIQERVKALEEKADLEASDVSAASITDLATIVRDLAAEVGTMARLMAERHEAELVYVARCDKIRKNLKKIKATLTRPAAVRKDPALAERIEKCISTSTRRQLATA